MNLCVCGHEHFKRRDGVFVECFELECPCRGYRPLRLDPRPVIRRRVLALMEAVESCPHSFRDVRRVNPRTDLERTA